MLPIRVLMDNDRTTITGDAARAWSWFGDNFPLVIVMMDPQMCCSWASPRVRNLLGYEPGDLVGISLAELVHPDDLVDAAAIADHAVGDAEGTIANPAAAAFVEFPVRLLTADGEYERFDVTGTIMDEDGSSLGVIRPSREHRVLDGVIESLGSGGQLSTVLESIVELVCTQFGVPRAWVVHDAGGRPEVVRRGGWRGTGAEQRAEAAAEELLGRARRSWLAPETFVDGATWGVPVLSETGESLFGVIGLPAPRAGGPAPLDQHLLQRAARLASVAFARDRDDRLLEQAATTDYLTGAANRRHFEARLAAAAVEPGALPLRLLYIDLDDFKAVNDTHGHRVGDQVLSAVVQRLSGCVRERDIVGRLGGDEFAVAAPGLSMEDLASLRSRIDRSLRAPLRIGDRSVSIGASIGVASAVDEDALETILERGDDDMFHLKRTARRSVTDTP